jgi:hypothetical protein
MARFEIVWQTAACLGDDFDATFDQPQPARVTLKRIERNIHHLAANMLDGLDDVRRARAGRCAGHQKTCKAPASMRARRHRASGHACHRVCVADGAGEIVRELKVANEPVAPAAAGEGGVIPRFAVTRLARRLTN